MRLLLAIIAVLVLAASLYADYRWRRWMSARRQERDRSDRSQLP
jgi:hypothetical protein